MTRSYRWRASAIRVRPGAVRDDAAVGGGWRPRMVGRMTGALHPALMRPAH